MAWQAPRNDRGILAAPSLAAAGELIANNRKRLAAWVDRRAQAGKEIIRLAQRYLESWNIAAPPCLGSRLIVTGHQPDLFHPGVWIKNFAVGALAARHGLTGLNLIVDNDLVKAAAVYVPSSIPTGPDDTRDGLTRRSLVAYDRLPGPQPYEEWSVHDEAEFSSFPHRVDEALAGATWQPFLRHFWQDVQETVSRTCRIGERFAVARRRWEERWGCRNLELPLSWLADSQAFRRFTADLLADAPHFQAIHNDALAAYRAKHHIRSRNHPVSDLATEGAWHEAPLWAWQAGDRQRGRLFVRSEGKCLELRAGSRTLGRIAVADLTALEDLRGQGWKIRPRALITTLFARLYLADLFLHGIGGALYDELTDEIIRGYIGLEPPEFLVVSGTLRLPQPPTPSERPADDLRRQLRRVWYSPERQLASSAVTTEVAGLARRKQELVADDPQTPDAKRDRFRAILGLNEQLRPLVAAAHTALQTQFEHARQQEESQKVWQNREYAFCLYPEDELREWFTKL